MTCEVIQFPGGGSAIVCSRRRPACSVCGKPGADRECDGLLDRVRYPRKGKSKTCDRPMHRSCAKQRGEKDYCPRHVGEADAPEQLQLTVDPPEGWGP